MCHLSALAMFIPIIPFGHIVGPLIVWLLKRGDYPTVNQHGKESLNFQISLTIYGLVSIFVVLASIFSIVGLVFLPFVIITLIIAWSALSILNLVLIVIAAVKAGDGQPYHYPLSIRLIS